MRNLVFCSTALASMALVSAPLAAQEQPAVVRSDRGILRASAGVNVSRGDYGDPETTTVVAVPVALKYKRGGFSVRVSIPWVSIDGPGSLLDTPQGRDSGFGDAGGGGTNSGSGTSGSGSSGSGSNSGSGSGRGSSTTGGGGTTVATSPTAASSHRSGFGDLGVTLGYSLDLADRTYLDLSGRVKLPTASTSERLGTGKVDFTLGADLVQDVGSATIYAGGRRKFVGRDAASSLRDVWGAGAGASYRFPGGTFIGADYDWQQSTTIGRGPSSEITGWVNLPASRRLRAQIFASTGLSTKSADFAGGLTLSYRLN